MPEHDSGEFSDEFPDANAPGRLPLFLGNRVRPPAGTPTRPPARPPSPPPEPPQREGFKPLDIQQLARKLDSIEAPPLNESGRLSLRRTLPSAEVPPQPSRPPSGGVPVLPTRPKAPRGSSIEKPPVRPQPGPPPSTEELVPDTMRRDFYRSQEEVPASIPPPSAVAAFARPDTPVAPLPVSEAPTTIIKSPFAPPSVEVPPQPPEAPAPPPAVPPVLEELNDPSAGERRLKVLAGVLAVIFVAILAWPKSGPHPSVPPTPEVADTGIPVTALESDLTGTPAPDSDIEAETETPAVAVAAPEKTVDAAPVAPKPAVPPKKAAKPSPPKSAPHLDPQPGGESGMMNLYTPAPSIPPSTVKPPGQLEPPSVTNPPTQNQTVQVTIIPRTVMAHIVISSSDNAYEDKGTGSFELPDVVPGTYTVKVTAVGYKAKVKAGVPVSDTHHNILVVLDEPATAAASTSSAPAAPQPPAHPNYPPPTRYSPPSPPPGKYEIPAPTL